MKAIQLVEHGKPGRFEQRELPQPQAGAGEVVVQVKACGLNHLDLWLEENGLPIGPQLPRTPGCEIAGIVAQAGAGAPWKPGDRVAIQSNLFCGHCEFCQQGEEALCLSGESLGIQRNGGFAEYVLAPANALVALPDGLDFTTSAALTLAGSTAMHMTTNRGQVRAGDWVLVIGASSGVGSAAIQIAKGLGAKVISTGSTAEKRQLGLKLGADFMVDSTDPKWSSEVRKITNKRGVDFVVEHVGGDVLPKIFDCLARGGTVVTCGATAGRDISLNIWPFFVKQQRLIGSYGRNRADMRATLEWAAAGKLKAVIDRVYPLEKTAEAFLALRERRVLGKVVVTP